MEPMNTMAQTNWKTVRSEYETLGTGIKELASSHHTTEALVNAAIEDGDWVTQSPDDMNTEDLSARLAALEVRHQAELVPKFISLQAKMLEKCDVLLDGVEKLEDANSLKIVSEVIEKHRPAIMGAKKEGSADNAFTIRIMSQVGEGPLVAVNAVEITSTAGESNGCGSVNTTGVPHGTPTEH